MGWTYLYKPKSVSVKEWFESELNDRYELLDSAIVKLRTFYAAVKDKKTGEVFAVVYLLDFKGYDGFNFGYKDMDETMGPVESECPERILKLLTPTDSKWANEWRKRCWENVEKRKSRPKVTDGCRIKFDSPISFTDGTERDEFTVLKEGNRVRFEADGYLYRISRWRDRPFQIVG